MKVLLTAACASVAALCLSAGTALADDGTAAACNGDGATSVVNVTFTLTDDADSGFGGNAWASDTIHRTLRIWAEADGSFCAVVHDAGSFVTFAGTSPSGGSTVSAGIDGVLHGGYVATIQGSLAATPAYPTSGNPSQDPNTWAKCTSVGVPSPQFCDNSNDHYGNYTEPSWANGGSKPIIFPWLMLQTGIRYKPVRSFAGRIDLGFGTSGFMIGIGGDYGLPD